MKMTKKQGKALELAFNNESIRTMKPDEYKIHMQTVLALSLQTVRANHGDEFVAAFVDIALSKPVDFIAQQQKVH